MSQPVDDDSLPGFPITPEVRRRRTAGTNPDSSLREMVPRAPDKMTTRESSPDASLTKGDRLKTFINHEQPNGKSWTENGSNNCHSCDTRCSSPEAVELTPISEQSKPLLDYHSGDEQDNMASDSVKIKCVRPGEGDEEVAGAESAWVIAVQVFIPFLVAGFGMVGAGLVLDTVQHWKVFRVVSEIFILVPALLGLKGNLEMTLASRLSTQANLGHMDKSSEQWKMIIGNLALVECQAIVVGFLASVVAIVMSLFQGGLHSFEFDHALLLSASSLVTAAVASFVLGCIMIVVIVLSRKCRINPDNVATPIAASMGDLTTLAMLAAISTVLFQAIDKQVWLAPTVFVILIMALPLCALLAKENKYTSKVLYNGWLPVISAMAISSLGGLVLDFTVTTFKGIAVFQPVINGVGGNLVAVQASRISTSLHLSSELGKLPDHANDFSLNPIKAFFGKDIHSKTARVLMMMVIPGHLIFSYTISYVKAGHTSLTPIFIITYLCAAIIQVAILLYLAHVMVHYMWQNGIDPDNSAIPYLTALGDLIGTSLLAGAFLFLSFIGDGDSDVGD